MVDGLDLQQRKAFYSCCAGEGTAAAAIRSVPAPAADPGRWSSWRFLAALRPNRHRPGRTGDDR
jgi:hypothetical protein